MRHLVLYIPGLGDHYDGGRSFALKGWRVWGVEVKLLPIKWYDGGSYQDKLNLVLQAIDSGVKDGYKVTLVGESAGASLALNAAALASTVSRVILVAGVNSSQLPISPHLKKRSASFAESASRVSESLKTMDRTKIHTVRALWDPVVSPRFDAIKDAHPHVLFSIGHIPTIALCLSVFSWFIAKLVKQK